MEIVFNNLCCYENKNSSKKVYLDEINLNISEGEIAFFISDDIQILNDLFMLNRRPSKGELNFGNIILKRTSHVEKNDIIKKIGYVSCNILPDMKIVKDELLNAMKKYGYFTKDMEKHIVDSLKIAGLDDSFLNREINTLSLTEQKKFLLARAMCYNPEVLIVEDFSKGMICREKEYFRKLFLKLKNNFKKTIIVIGTDLSFCFDIVDKVFVINNGKLVINSDKHVFYDDNLYNYIEMPKIVEFTKYAEVKGHNILEYTDFKELIKELYRNIK